MGLRHRRGGSSASLPVGTVLLALGPAWQPPPRPAAARHVRRPDRAAPAVTGHLGSDVGDGLLDPLGRRGPAGHGLRGDGGRPDRCRPGAPDVRGRRGGGARHRVGAGLHGARPLHRRGPGHRRHLHLHGHRLERRAGPPPCAEPPIVPTATTDPAPGYWLVGSDGGIFSFGAAAFYGSTGGLALQRPVVGMVPTADHRGYWEVGSDGGVFAFGDAGFHGSIPGLGIAPAGPPARAAASRPRSWPSCRPPTAAGTSWWAPTAGCSPSATPPSPGRARASAPARERRVGAARRHRRWLLAGDVGRRRLRLRRRPLPRGPGPTPSPITSTVRSPDGYGYWILLADGAVYAYGDAPYLGAAAGGRERPGQGRVRPRRGARLLDRDRRRRRVGVRVRPRSRRHVGGPPGLNGPSSSDRRPGSEPTPSSRRPAPPSRQSPPGSSSARPGGPYVPSTVESYAPPHGDDDGGRPHVPLVAADEDVVRPPPPAATARAWRRISVA